MKEVIIQANDANQRLDKFLQKTFPNLSKSMMYKGIRKKKIKVNRKRCSFDQVLEEGDSILLFLPPEFLEEKVRKVSSGSDALDIVYEDANLLILHKPVGLLSQSDGSNADCLVARMQRYLIKKGEYSLAEHSFSPAICQRLDRNTEGLVIGAKNADTLRTINTAIAQRKVKKIYQAECCGHISKPVEMNYYIKKVGTKAMVSKTKKEGYQEAKMDLIPLAYTNDSTFVEVHLHTGRFHQIRALCASIGHPLVGDHKYGYKGEKKGYHLIAMQLNLEALDLDLPQKIFTIPGLVRKM